MCFIFGLLWHFFYKMQQLFYCKMRQNFITKRMKSFITKCGSYYKMRRLLQNASVHRAKAEKYWFQETMKIYSTV